MSAPGYGETQPRPVDDRLPIILVILDGLGDRPVPELDGHTPAEAAHTPVLDRLAARGASGWHVPFGWGQAPSSELAHWAMFGYSGVRFPGRAVLEVLGADLDVPPGVAITFGSLRSSRVTDGRIWITGRAASDDRADADALLAELAPLLAARHVDLQPLGRGEAALLLHDYPRGDVSDSDPFFEDLHPWLKVQATQPEAFGLAAELNTLLHRIREVLVRSPVNRARHAAGKPALDTLTTKWSGAREPLPSFQQQIGIAGAAVTDIRLYRGIAALLGMASTQLATGEDLATDLASRIDAAQELIAHGAQFVHVHTKVSDLAGHSKQPRAKLEVLEALDPGLVALEGLAERAIVAVTGDHATPSVNGVLHTGDPTPLVIAGPTVRSDQVQRFGELYARDGWYGVVHAPELLPLLLSHANRPAFLGHRPGAIRTLALPDQPEPMPLV